MLTESPLRRVVSTFDLREHADRLDDRERDASLGLIVMVIGAGNFGKSSLINALCGREVAPVSVIPKTFKIDVFSYGRAGTALVRRVGEARPNEMTTEHARLVESEAERQFSDRNQVRLAEIIWRYENLNLPRGISLVDTPGISQAIGSGAKGISLTTVLGSTFEVDEVWARWFHRADLVLWAFCANKMEDADTQSALESALKLFDKPILPIATKADLIPQERWPEIHERFNAVYGPILGERQAGELQLTVCGGKRPELSGTGIKELRDTLLKVGSEAMAIKQYADEAFLRDESAAVSMLLDQTAMTLVTNLRAIASLGDALAEEAEKEAERGRQEAIRRVNNYLGEVRRNPMLPEVARSVHGLTKGGRSGNIATEAKQRLISLIDERHIEREVNEAFAESARSLEATATRLSQGTDITRLSFKSSGKVTSQAVPLRLKLKAFAVTSKLEFPMQLENPSGFLGNAWDVIKRVLGLDRFSLSDIQVAMSSALLVPETEMEVAMLQALHEGFAPALKDAVETALRDHLNTSDSEALSLLSAVDASLPLLAPASAQPEVTTYGPQAAYWSSLSPDVDILIGLARQELANELDEFRVLLQEPFAFESPQVFPAFDQIWPHRKLSSKRVSVQIRLSKVMQEARLSEKSNEDSEDDGAFLPALLAAQLGHLTNSDLVTQLDERLAESVTGVEYQSAGIALAEIGAREFASAIEASSRTWRAASSRERLWNWDFGGGTLFGLVAAMLVGIVMMFIRRDAGFSCIAFGIMWCIIGFFRPQIELSTRYRANIGTAVELEVVACQKDAATAMGPAHVQEILESMAAEISPRPLQRLLVAAELLEI